MKRNSPKSIRWKLIDEILDELLDSPSSEREAILITRCGADIGLRLEVEKLLAASERAGDFMEVSALESADLETTESLIGGCVGKYRLLRLLGRGGMGTVFLAARSDDEFRKTVAVKVVNSLWADDEMAQRFRRERQILAKLEHPNIARLIDGGTTKDKVSFLVMEYVAGAPITEYCQDKCNTKSQLLNIFLKVCDAVKYAHQNLIIHRDLKPNNVLVTADGTVKLLDFGVAKLLQPELLDVSQNFTMGANILTPNYASPEQLKGEAITTASDVYSLGVLLYELLSGHRPYDLKDKSLPEILRIISQQVPPKPSDTIDNEQGKNQGTGGQRTTENGQKRALQFAIRNPKFLRGDLDNICMKALAKDRPERYQTVEELVADIKRHLASLPIHARAPSAWYRFNKYVNRHRFGVAAASLILILVFGWLTSALWQRNVARGQADRNLRRAYAADMNLGMQAYETANLTRLNDILAHYKNTSFTNNWEYRFLQNLAKPRGQLLMIPHASDVWDVTFSPDSKKLATACADGFARIYQAPEGTLLTTTATREANIWRVRFSPDGRLLATASGDSDSNSAKVWNSASGAEILSLIGHTDRIRGLDFSPDGKVIATGSRDGTIRIWSAVDGRELRKFVVERTGQPQETDDLHFTPDGTKLVAASRRNFRVLEVSSGRVLFNFDEGGENWVTATVSPDGKRFALGRSDSTIHLFNSNPTKQVLEIARHEAKVNNLAFSPDSSMIASASSDRTVRFFDVQAGTESQNLKTHLSDAWSVAFSPDRKFIATSGTDFSVFLFDASELMKASSFGFSLTFGGSWSAISPDRSKVALPVSLLNPIHTQSLWDVTSKRKIAEFSTEFIEAGSFSPDSAVLATGNRGGTISLWSSATGAEIRRFKAHDDRIVSLVFAPDGKRLISASRDKTVRIWDVDNPVGFRELCRLDADVSALGVSADGSRVFVASYDTTAKLIDFEAGKVIAEIGKQPKAVLSLAFAPNGKMFATGNAGGAIEIRQNADARLLATLTGNTGHLTALTYSPDGLRLASASGEGVIRLWDTKTGDQVLAIRTGSPITSFLAFTPDGNTLISHDTVGKVRLWDAAPR
jgi:eukaryotic-like serine/threonine-protein kinase